MWADPLRHRLDRREQAEVKYALYGIHSSGGQIPARTARKSPPPVGNSLTITSPLQASLATLVAQIEEMVPELDQDKKDIDSTQALLTEAEAAYQAKATALTGVKAKLTRAKNDMAHATLEEQRAARSPA